jgi:hypothetical protein
MDFIIIFFFKNYAILGLFHHLEEYIGPSIFTVDVLYPFFFLGCMSDFSLEFFPLPFVKHDFFTVT